MACVFCKLEINPFLIVSIVFFFCFIIAAICLVHDVRYRDSNKVRQKMSEGFEALCSCCKDLADASERG